MTSAKQMKSRSALGRALRIGWVLALLAVASPARPETLAAGGGKDPDPSPGPPEDRPRTTLHADLLGRHNPVGLMLMAGGYRRWPIRTAPETGATLAYLQAGLSAGVNPAYGQLSAHVEWMPAPFLRLRAVYDLFGYFGANGALLSFPSADAPFGDDELDARSGTEESGTGHRFSLQPVLRFRIGPVILRNRTELAYHRFDGAGPYFYEWAYDTLLRDGDVLLDTRTQVFVEAWKGTGAAALFAGPFHQFTRAFDAGLDRQRVGGLVHYVPTQRLWSLDRPRFFARVGVNVRDRNREGEVFALFGLGIDLDL